MHWCGKIRGPDFSPFGYRLRTVPTGLTDEKDRPEITIIAEPMSEEAIADHSKQALANEDAVLMALRDNPDWSYAQIARHLGWVDDGGNPMKSRVQRAIAVLAADKLVTQSRHGAPWTLTDKGNEAVPQNATPQPGATPTKTTKPETKPPPTDATRQASIDRLAAMRDLDLDPIRKQEAAALGITVPTLNREIKQARFAAAAADAKPTEAAAPPEPALSEAEIDAEIDRIAHLSDAAFLALDRQALAARLHCTRAELIAMRRGKRAARGKRRTKKPADKAPNDPARGRTGGRIGGNAGYGLRYGRILQIRNDDTARYDTQVIAVPPRFNPYRRAIRGGVLTPPLFVSYLNLSLKEAIRRYGTPFPPSAKPSGNASGNEKGGPAARPRTQERRNRHRGT